MRIPGRHRDRDSDREGSGAPCPNAGAAAVAADVPRSVALNRTRADRAYRAFCLACGLATLVILVLIGAFLLIRAWPALKVAGWRFLTTEQLPPVLDGRTRRSASVP